MVYSKLNIRLVSIGNLDEEFLRSFKEEFQKLVYDAVGIEAKCFFSLPSQSKDSEDRIFNYKIPSTAYNPRVGKYSTNSLFLFGRQRMEETSKIVKSPNFLKIMLLTDFDIYREGHEGILFGEAEKGGDIGIVSTANLKDSRKDTSLKKDEAIKEALHVFGYLFGLEACNTPGCAMNIAKDVRDIDNRNKAYCKDCLEKLFF